MRPRHTWIRLLLTALCFTGLLATAAFASDKDDVAAAARSLYTDMDSGNLPGISRLVPPTGFSEITPDSPEVQRLDRSAFAGLFKSGLHIAFRAEDVQVQLFGRTAIVTGVRVGSINKPSDTPVETTNPFTMVWLKSNGGWQVYHVHLSESAKASHPE